MAVGGARPGSPFAIPCLGMRARRRCTVAAVVRSSLYLCCCNLINPNVTVTRPLTTSAGVAPGPIVTKLRGATAELCSWAYLRRIRGAGANFGYGAKTSREGGVQLQ